MNYDLCECWPDTAVVPPWRASRGLATEDHPYLEGKTLCIYCCLMWFHAIEDLGVNIGEFSSVPVEKRPHFLSDHLEQAIIAGESVNQDWAREVWNLVDQIKLDTARARFRSVQTEG